MANKKILLADDSATIQKVINLTFADEGIDVITVGDGNSAVSAFAQNAPDLVIADVNMPGIDGYEVCQRIRHGGVGSDVPVILLVGSFESFDQARASQVGANAHITKPFTSIRNVVTLVSALLAEHAASRAAATPPPAAVSAPVVVDELLEAYTPDTVRLPKIGDDILQGSELDSLLSGSKTVGAPIDDFDILDIPVQVAPKPVVQHVPEPPKPPVAVQGAPEPQPVYAASQAIYAQEFVVSVPQPQVQSQAPVLSRADIEAIASTLSQKLSEDVIREIAMKIVPEVTAKIIEKMVEQAANRR